MLVRTCPQTLRANVIVLPQSVSPVVVALGNSMNTLLVSCNLICTAAAAQIEPNNEQSFEAGSQAQCGRAAGAAPREVGGPANPGAAWGLALPFGSDASSARRGFVLANVLSWDLVHSLLDPTRTQKGLETNVAKNQPHTAPRSTPGFGMN
eukprot:s351_g16.t1